MDDTIQKNLNILLEVIEGEPILCDYYGALNNIDYTTTNKTDLEIDLSSFYNYETFINKHYTKSDYLYIVFDIVYFRTPVIILSSIDDNEYLLEIRMSGRDDRNLCSRKLYSKELIETITWILNQEIPFFNESGIPIIGYSLSKYLAYYNREYVDNYKVISYFYDMNKILDYVDNIQTIYFNITSANNNEGLFSNEIMDKYGSLRKSAELFAMFELLIRE